VPSSKPVPTGNKRQSDLSVDDISIFDSVQPDRQLPTAETPQLVSVEVNTLALPYAELNTRNAATSSGHELIKFEKNGSDSVAWLWRVTPDPEYGMPTAFTMRVLYGLSHIACQQRNDEGMLPDIVEIGSLNSFCTLIGSKPDRKTRALVRKHIEILLYTTCKSKGAFKNKKGKGLLLERFSYLKRAGFMGSKDEEGNEVERNFVVFDDALKKNLETNYIKSIDLAFMRILKTPVAQMLYTHISNLFHQKENWPYAEADYDWLAERMGLTVYEHKRRAKQQFKTALSELVEQRYLDKFEWLDAPKLKLRFYPGVKYTVGESAARQARKALAQSSKKSKRAKPTAKQLQLPIHQEISQEDRREIALVREATRINLGIKPDIKTLEANGWKLEDAYFKAGELKSK